MNHTCVVLDSNVFAKSFLDEGDTETVKSLFRFISEHDLSIFCPEIFLYEVLSIAAQNSFPIARAHKMVTLLQRANLRLAPLTDQQLQLAMRMAEDGNPKSGFPSIYDSAYHALALSNNAVFITADKRHIAKAEKYGNVALLSEWKSHLIISDTPQR